MVKYEVGVILYENSDKDKRLKEVMNEKSMAGP
jgi:hypothetical protein